ncbi:hypothetical protein [Methylobacterium indicum]|uniref:Stability/partitioning determinant n=1 Tax=Methylobacterium indicum TaxID=1775910 RepID=A0ABR5GT61_9HYPH|nr:hypothetical protein [Methylobacterium indicum]KMO12512.1 hypothetical protein QR79_28245 [Methylobacterium indicum]KMO15751.1 hypothetical protein QR78_20550 [Methylobacterium indicum]
MTTKPKKKAGMDAEAVARMMAAQDVAEPEPEVVTPPAAPPAPEPIPALAPMPSPTPAPAPAPTFDPGKIDGRTLRRTGREPFATRIKPNTHETLRRIAYARGISLAEVVELAVAAFDKKGK